MRPDSCEHSNCAHTGCEPRLAAAADAVPAAADAAVDLGDAAADLALTSDAAESISEIQRLLDNGDGPRGSSHNPADKRVTTLPRRRSITTCCSQRSARERHTFARKCRHLRSNWWLPSTNNLWLQLPNHHHACARHCRCAARHARRHARSSFCERPILGHLGFPADQYTTEGSWYESTPTRVR